MFRIAIVEYHEQDAKRRQTPLERYAQEANVPLDCVHWSSPIAFLEGHRNQYDIIFMDIDMPLMDGMTAARKLREKDQMAVLVFLTSLSQYGVEGYEVDAVDFILKPLTYAALTLKLPRILKRCMGAGQEVVIQNGGSTTRLMSSEVTYVEIYDHHIQFMTTRGVVRAYGTLKEIEKNLPDVFFRLNKQTIVNLQYVSRVDGQESWVADRAFAISRNRRKDFLAALHGAKTRG